MITATSSFNPFHNATYGYDSLDRLYYANVNNWSPGSGLYTYDDADNMTYNSNVCWNATNSPNITYPAQGVAIGRPHAPTSICGTPVTYDANGNTLSYDQGGFFKTA